MQDYTIKQLGLRKVGIQLPLGLAARRWISELAAGRSRHKMVYRLLAVCTRRSSSHGRERFSQAQPCVVYRVDYLAVRTSSAIL